MNSITVPKWTLAVVPLIAMLIGIGISYGVQKTTVEFHAEAIRKNTKEISEIQQQISVLKEIRTDIKWIKAELNRNKNRVSK